MVTLLHSDGRKWKRAGHRSAGRARVWPPWPSGVIRRLSTQEEEWARAMARGLLGTRIDELVYISRCSKYEDSISNSLEGSQIGARSESNQSTWHPLKAENKRPWPFIFALFSRHAIPFRHAMLSLVMRIPILSEKHLQCGGRASSSVPRIIFAAIVTMTCLYSAFPSLQVTSQKLVTSNDIEDARPNGNNRKMRRACFRYR